MDPEHSGVPLLCLPFAGSGASFFHPWNRLGLRGVVAAPLQLPGRERLVDEKPYRDMHAAVDGLLPAAVTVVCLPYAGGNAVHFKPVADAVARLDSRLAVVAVELPGHTPGSTVDDLRSLADTATSVAAEIEHMAGPIVLWGHCNGSPLAVETARLLAERGRPIRHLFLAAMLVGSAEDIRKTLRDTETLTFGDIRQYLTEWTGTTELEGVGAGYEDLVTRTFRHDALGANEFLLTGRESGAWRPLTTSCTVVVASDDKLTVGYQHGYREWELFVEHPALHELDGGGAYFTRTRPEQVAELIELTVREQPD
jgi:surfactin synthase thioesterase subunit